MNIPPDHPQRRRTDETILHTVRNTTSGRHVEPLHVSLPNGRPVDFTRPMGVADRQRQAEREAALARVNAAKPSRRQQVVDGGYLRLGLGLAALVVLVIASVVIVFNWWWPL